MIARGLNPVCRTQCITFHLAVQALLLKARQGFRARYLRPLPVLDTIRATDRGMTNLETLVL